jgi:hypothetical protein
VEADALLICNALYAGQWKSVSDDLLSTADSQLRESLGDDAVQVTGVCLLDGLMNGDDADVPLRRAELAPCVVNAAELRAAPQLISG